MNDHVVITGTGLVSSLGLTASETWDALLSGKHGIQQIDGFDARGFDCQEAAQVHGLNASELNIHPRDARIMDKHSYMLMKSSHDAFKQANLETASIPGEEIGFFVGMGMVDYKIEDIIPSVLKSIDPAPLTVQGDPQCNMDYNTFFSQGYQVIYPLWPLSMLNNISFCQVAINLGIKGENTVFSPHSDSGIHAVAQAVKTIIDEKAKVALAGGVSEKVSPLSLARASLFGILNTSANKMGCRPFGKDRNGTILGEGCGILTLELRSSADERGVPYLAAITGSGFAFEKSEESNCPTARAISQTMEETIASAKLKPSDIDVIIAHGDGTRTGDKNETEAIHKVFADSINKINVFSSKGALGHLLAGAPAVDTILGIFILKNGIIPATYNSLPPEDNIMFNLVNSKPLKVHPKRIMINAQSYEGQCASLIIESV